MLQGLHGGKLGQHFFNAVIAKHDREFELIAIAFTLLHHPSAKMLVVHLGAYAIRGRSRGLSTSDGRFSGRCTRASSGRRQSSRPGLAMARC